jgi:hypothetical protein
MKAVHSFWSKAYFEGRWGEESKIEHDIYNFALSCHFARKTFKNIDLVTDEIGASLLEGLPYSNIGTDLEDLSNIDGRFWTAGKVHTMRVQEEPFIHLDGDVFLVDKKIKKRMSGKWDAIVQMREAGDHYYSTYPKVFDNLSKVHKGIHSINIFNFVYNHGIIGFQNMDLLKEYSHEYFDLIHLLELLGVEFPADADPNVALEQSLLTTITETSNLHVKELITVRDMQKHDLFGSASKIGFVHLWGNSKYQPKYTEKVRMRLKKENPTLYKHVREVVRNL